MTLAALSLCGPRHLPPPRTEAFDTVKGKDPTKTYFLRARMRRDGDKRWQLLAQTLRQALIQHDIAGMRGVGGLPHGDKTEGFGLWLREELRQKVFGLDGRWVRPYVQEATAIAQKHALQYVNGRVDLGRTATMENLAVSELRGIAEAAQQQLTRVMTHAMMANCSPTKAANALAGVIRTMRQRTRAMSEHIIAKTHATATLSAYRDAGVTHVGVIPERKSKFHISQTKHGKVLVKDADVDLDALFARTETLVERATINRDYDVIELSNRSRDGKTVYIDKHVPDVLKDTDIRPDDTLPWHELAEWMMMNRGLSYLPAHKIATQIEKRRVQQIKPGVWDEYQEEMGGLISDAEERGYGKEPPNQDRRVFDAGSEDEPRDPHGRWTSGGGQSELRLEGGGNERWNAAAHRWFGESKVVTESGAPRMVYHGTTTPKEFSEFSMGEPPETREDDELYRSGSGADPRTFLGSHFAEEASVANKFAKGLYGEREGMLEGGRVLPVFLRIEHPYVTTDSDMLDEMLREGYNHSDIDSILQEYEEGDIDSDKLNEQYETDPDFRADVNKHAMEIGGRGEGEPDFSLAHEMASNYRSNLKEKGYDGIKYTNEIEGGTSWIAFEPDQIKSALGSGFTRGKPGIKDARVGWSPGLTGKKSSRIFKRKRFKPIEEVPSYAEVDVVTAGDNDVCPTCEEISDYGPYELDEAEDLIPAHPWCRCAFAPAGKYAKDYDPNEPRDPHGRWTTGGGLLTFGGGAEAFVSPNINEGTFAQARSRLWSPEQRELAKASTYIDGKLGLKTENHSVLGAWADGAENSMMVTMSDVPFEQAKVASAMKGYIADQKSVLVFDPHSDGDSYMATFKATGSLEDMHSNLLKDGVAFHTLEPTQDGAMVHVFGSDQETIDAVSKAAKRYGAEFTVKAGHGEFVGTTKTDGTDREQRDDAKRVYSEVIQKAAATQQFAGHDVGRVWEDVRHNWPNLQVSGGASPKAGFEGSSAAREEEDPSEATLRVDALRKEMEASSGFGARDLTPAQRQALDMYIYSSTQINSDARKGYKTTEGDVLESAINHFKTPRDMVVYRRIGWNDLNGKFKAHVGKDFTEDGFMSTTMDEGMTFKPGSYVEIHVPKGVSALPIGSLATFPEEAEVLFPRGSRMAVESFTPLKAPNSFKFMARMYAD